jgi:hypothetical protein
MDSFPGLSAGPVLNDLGTGTDSWTVKDNHSSGGGRYFYVVPFTNPQASLALTQGWKLDACLRVVDAPDPPADFSVYFGFNLAVSNLTTHYSKLFSMSLGSTPNGDPIVQLVDSSAQPNLINLELDGAGSGYHPYEFQFDPASQSADLSVDGQPLFAGYKGFTSSPSNSLVWGTLDYSITGGEGTGQANYNLVQLEIVPEPASLVLATIGVAFLILVLFQNLRRCPAGRAPSAKVT